MSKLALIVIDMINDFVLNPSGPLYCQTAEEHIPKIIQAINFFHEQGVQVILIKDAHRPNDGDFTARPVHAVKGTWGAELVEPLKQVINRNDYIIDKRRYSGFSYTDLDLFLREEKIDSLVLIGAWTNTGIRSTASDAFYQGYKITVLEDCCFSQTEEMHKAGLADIAMFGEVKRLEEFVQDFKKRSIL